MRICVVSTGYPSKDGVRYAFVEQLVNAFVLQGNECIVIAPVHRADLKANRIDAPEYDEKKVGEQVVRVFRPRYYLRNINLFGLSTTRWDARRVLEDTIRKKNLKFDCFYCHFFSNGILAWRFARKNHIPLFIATGESVINPHFMFASLTFSWEKFRNDTNGVICVSTKNLEEAVSLRYADKEKCKVFPNGVNESFRPLNKEQTRKTLGLPLDKFIIICVGSFIHRKGQMRIIQALDKLGNNEIAALFIGSGDEIDSRDYILYKGSVPHDQLPVYLNAADVFVLPTLKEGCCNAIVEAMACGLPIISSDRSFNWDILDASNSLMIEPESIDDISAAVAKLYKNKKLASRLSEGALLKAKSLTVFERAKQITDFIKVRL